MNDYQQKKLKSYVMPQPVYRQALWAVKDLDRLKIRLKELKADAYVLGGYDMTMPAAGYGTGRVCDSTGSKAVEIAHLSRRIEAIENALMQVPERYREGIMARMTQDDPYNEETAHINSWRRWQQVFLYYVAHNLKIF
ncbi:MAG: hypothetical protein IKM19_02505 [Firmicutes bacterium]|nr:hypothetical protein [Bacillota bacterium]MBR6584061.1 hypothetical protein [Bacillota bacterium]